MRPQKSRSGNFKSTTPTLYGHRHPRLPRRCILSFAIMPPSYPSIFSCQCLSLRPSYMSAAIHPPRRHNLSTTPHYPTSKSTFSSPARTPTPTSTFSSPARTPTPTSTSSSPARTPTPTSSSSSPPSAPLKSSASSSAAAPTASLNRPLGLPHPPHAGENTGIDPRTWRQRRDDFLNWDKHLERRKELSVIYRTLLAPLYQHTRIADDADRITTIAPPKS